MTLHLSIVLSKGTSGYFRVVVARKIVGEGAIDCGRRLGVKIIGRHWEGGIDRGRRLGVRIMGRHWEGGVDRGRRLGVRIMGRHWEGGVDRGRRLGVRIMGNYGWPMGQRVVVALKVKCDGGTNSRGLHVRIIGRNRRPIGHTVVAALKVVCSGETSRGRRLGVRITGRHLVGKYTGLCALRRGEGESIYRVPPACVG